MNTIVVAVGNGGGNVVDDFRKECPDIQGVEYLYLDEDTGKLERHGAGRERKMILERTCRSLGEIFAGRYDAAIVVVCLGGFTGDYYADAIAEELRGRCDKLLCIASLPFVFEGPKRRADAMAALGNIKRWCDLAEIQDNNSLPPGADLNEMNGPMVGSLLNHIKEQL